MKRWKRRWTAGLLMAALLTGMARAQAPAAQTPTVGYVALTFDDGPSGPVTNRLLDGLRERGARATFFLCGYRMEQYPSPLERYLAEGHELGVHSGAHTDMTRLTEEALHRDMEETARKILATTGAKPVVMRPPGGAYNDRVRQEAAAEGMSIILWSVDPRDWASRSAGTVLEAMAGQVGDGDIILMHDMWDSSVEAALALVDRLQAQGFRFVTVSELAALSGRELTPGKVYEDFRESR